ncbi:efflux RND transporter periplasmic adaptor subunit [Flavihumibacter sp. CACIAM 22H1]|uniref:efflux RND transporter periplasmic adaptor subunit n=1 Tax=Flavihumibacter sp. CACIAM 22H1 TaxID=1812911 RepID=UPI0007A8C62C|nr:efflux RND transporter periplasmic adaptor subunit [Flavihumibacter sp. CACIAM 22H1]KYP16322.1 MAG: efflux transporter periplasmic adaptor subunit [Flavihumibacter sp. CACIAM 22H1]
MQASIQQLLLSSSLLLLLACGNNSMVDKKKEELSKLKAQQLSTTEQIAKLEKEILQLDSTAIPPEKPKLVVTAPLNTAPFTHYIDLQGKIEAVNISYVTPRGMGGQVRAIYVKQGDQVAKGKLLLKLDDAVIHQQLQTAKTQLDYAKNLYNRQKNLWDQNIGTEVQLITAKNNVDQAERQIGILEEQLAMTNVYAQVSGIADEVNIKVGETFTGSPMNGIRIVNTSDLKAVAQVPENYLERVKVGSPVKVILPDINKSFSTKVSVSGKLIDPNSRSFYIESKMPADKMVRPNQIANIRIEDYTVKDAITIPVNTLQNDEKGKFVLVAVNEGGKLRAKKRPVETGELYGNELEIHKGLQAGDQLITEGFQGLYDGQLITTSL